ncbi:LOW QUALITY PROTEIN: MICOS complex subunit MIC25 [Marmota marmota marmota]|uniref:LOW QUALITY PROTEIN: MICOS complex subunit MIC25 n=1 Tax=Marmota marmota marmota TaxID=9994 RepID=UPI000762978E|nr:LOW QUALITY PROTEIN: MICOS complex subunit MIC25 [Marmota marmota marmota]
MGSTESCESRRVSFGLDEEERVRVLQGIRLSENVVNRMKDPCQPPSPPYCTCTPAEGGSRAPLRESKLPQFDTSGEQQPSEVKEDLKRFQQEQASIQEELFQVVTREREAAAKHLKAPPPRDSSCTDPEEPKSAQLARELESREAEQRRREAFYREQLERIGKKNAEMYKLSSQQFREAATKAESAIRPRRVEPVCSGLQAQILRCYRDHLSEVLCCSDLVKAYQHCVSAHKG